MGERVLDPSSRDTQEGGTSAHASFIFPLPLVRQMYRLKRRYGPEKPSLLNPAEAHPPSGPRWYSTCTVQYIREIPGWMIDRRFIHKHNFPIPSHQIPFPSPSNTGKKQADSRSHTYSSSTLQRSHGNNNNNNNNKKLSSAGILIHFFFSQHPLSIVSNLADMINA